MAVTALLESIPGAPTAPDDVRVWWTLVTTFEGTDDWAREARAEHHLMVEAIVASIVGLAQLDETQARYERERLCALVDGTGRRILDGRLGYDDGIDMIHGHLRLVLPALHDASGDAA